jgi:transcriptional regulator with XRE-family HTH domain
MSSKKKTSRPEANVALGERLASMMADRGLTDQALSDLSGVERSEINRYRRGDRFPGPHAIFCLATALGLEPSELLNDLPLPEAVRAPFEKLQAKMLADRMEIDELKQKHDALAKELKEARLLHASEIEELKRERDTAEEEVTLLRKHWNAAKDRLREEVDRHRATHALATRIEAHRDQLLAANAELRGRLANKPGEIFAGSVLAAILGVGLGSALASDN